MSGSASSAWAHLPGGEYLAEGVGDLIREKETISALLLAIAATRITQAGVPLPGIPAGNIELRLFRLLRSLHGDDAHSQYNAHLRRLGSLCGALETLADDTSSGAM